MGSVAHGTEPTTSSSDCRVAQSSLPRSYLKVQQQVPIRNRPAQSSVSHAWPKPGTLAQTRRLPFPFRLALPPIESHAQ